MECNDARMLYSQVACYAGLSYDGAVVRMQDPHYHKVTSSSPVISMSSKEIGLLLY